MRNIIKDRQIVADRWLHLDDDALVPDTGELIVSWARWQREGETLRARRQGVGVRIDGDVPVAEVAEQLLDRPLIALDFPVFKDGRCLTHARLLRERYGYTGELRAVGDVLRDQMFYMQRVGINAFEVREDRDLADALQSLNDFSLSYQAAADQQERIYQRRLRSA
ncbi:DUF934 domain-containing protein [Alkalilimnicola sp. S0819]|uniref:DUF934 domain-containing protein n=1 Tax=Alkalilimnicola sp. S0819 TaxID=2613922 RepID=UPI001262A0C4|nr:DUF934 domain-containing protein [Alkalilimnicola sp. S0819]KAB7622648.1 DUF934 domain-containing protein [Alkalilimnicola sp. S0819]MPQ17419.1 DUF934 domain-containing protein [Alkalilimnicola sp. S0819]